MHFLTPKPTHCEKDQQWFDGETQQLLKVKERGRRVCVSVNGHLVKCPFIDPLTNISSKRGSQLK